MLASWYLFLAKHIEDLVISYTQFGEHCDLQGLTRILNFVKKGVFDGVRSMLGNKSYFARDMEEPLTPQEIIKTQHIQAVEMNSNQKHGSQENHSMLSGKTCYNHWSTANLFGSLTTLA